MAVASRTSWQEQLRFSCGLLSRSCARNHEARVVLYTVPTCPHYSGRWLLSQRFRSRDTEVNGYRHMLLIHTELISQLIGPDAYI